MKKQGMSNTKLGIFVTATLALLITGVYFIGRKGQLFNDTFRVSAIFRDVNGLQVGNNVRFSGINVGTVDAIEITSDSTVRVDMIIDARTRKFIRRDATAMIGSDGLMGNKIAVISPGISGPTIKNNEIIESRQPITMEDIMSQLKRTTSNASQITDDLTAITGSIRSGKGVIGKLFMDSTLADNVDQSIQNIKEGAGGFKKNMDAARQSFILRHFLINKKVKPKKEDSSQKK